MNSTRVQSLVSLFSQILSRSFLSCHREEPEPEGSVSAEEGGGEGVWSHV